MLSHLKNMEEFKRHEIINDSHMYKLVLKLGCYLMRLVGMQVDMIVDKIASLSFYPTPEIQREKHEYHMPPNRTIIYIILT